MLMLFARTLTLGMLTFAAVAAHAQTKVLFNSFLAKHHWWNTEVITPWLADVTKATGGRVVFEVPSTSMAAPNAQYEGVTKGLFDATYLANPFIASFVKLPLIAQLPFTQVSAEASTIALGRTYDKFFAAANEYKDVQVIGFYVGGSADIVSGGKPINSAADLKGMKIYALPGGTVDILQKAGAAVVAAPAVRSYELISGGAVDGFAGISSFDFEQFKSMQYGKQVVRVPGGTAAPVFTFIMNKATWAKISPDDQKTILRLARDPLAKYIGWVDRAARDADQRFVNAGIKVAPPSPAFEAELKKLAQPTIDAWLEDAKKLGVDGKAALAFYQSEAQAVAKQLAAGK